MDAPSRNRSNRGIQHMVKAAQPVSVLKYTILPGGEGTRFHCARDCTRGYLHHGVSVSCLHQSCRWVHAEAWGWRLLPSGLGVDFRRRDALVSSNSLVSTCCIAVCLLGAGCWQRVEVQTEVHRHKPAREWGNTVLYGYIPVTYGNKRVKALGTFVTYHTIQDYIPHSRISLPLIPSSRCFVASKQFPHGAVHYHFGQNERVNQNQKRTLMT